jgi:glycogen debranching enzyme
MRFDGRESSITQPQVLAWAALFLNERAPDADFLTWAAPHLQAFLDWTVANRDRNGNGLLGWHTGSRPNRRCDESGLDNSPRFDFDTDGIDAIDFSCYLAHEAGCLAEIWRLLGRDEKAAEADALRGRTAERINALLWDEASGLYFDRLFDGCLSHVATVASFLPLWAGVCPPERAARLVAVHPEHARLWTALPIPSVARDSACFDTDMWRGCSWLNLDYLIWLGLRRYGYEAKATELRHRVLASVNRWYLRHGTVFEFYDADDVLSPYELKRKGPPVLPPDWRKHMHSISDYHWSAAFTRLFLEEMP